MMSKKYLLYSNRGSETGNRLGQYLGIRHGKSDKFKELEEDEGRFDYLLRYGESSRIKYIPSEKTINKRSSISSNTNKYEILKTLEQHGINTPKVSTNPEDLDYPMLARSSNHSQGSDIKLILQQIDIERINPDYFIEYEPTKLEYRVHVIDEEIVKVSQKDFRGDDYTPWVRNYETGWVFINPEEVHKGIYLALSVVKILDLDFGAVDLIISEKDKPLILECNTAPGLCENSLPVYGEAFVDLLDIEEYPGLENVNWEEENEEDNEERGD